MPAFGRRTFFAEGNKIPRYWRTGWSLWGGLGQAEAARKSADAPFWSGGTGPGLEEGQVPEPRHVDRDCRGVTRPTPGTTRSNYEGLRSVS